MIRAGIKDYTGMDEQMIREEITAARVKPVLDRISDKWTILILMVICGQPVRFNAIQRQLDGITHKAPSDALKRLERNGLVTRTVLPTQPPGVEYGITALGKSLRPLFQELCGWALTHGEELRTAQLTYDRVTGES